VARRPGRIPPIEPRGAKRSVLTESAGVPVGLDHDGANRNDHKLLKRTLDSIPIERPEATTEQPQGICLDKAYDNTEVRELIGDYALTRRTSVHAARRSTSRLTDGYGVLVMPDAPPLHVLLELVVHPFSSLVYTSRVLPV
jgi:hypothetical protein